MSLPSPPGGANVRVLVFHGLGAARSRRPWTPGIAAIEKIGRSGPAAERFKTVRPPTTPSVFTNETKLGKFNAVVFLTGGGDVLDPEQEAGLEAYMEAGGGFLGIHDAARAEPYSDWFTGLVGARPAADSPTAVQRATVEVGDRQHPATKDLPAGVEAPRPVAQLGEEPVRRRCTPWPACGSAPTSPGDERQRLGPPGLLVP